jgi:hypothetical protein
MSYWWICLFAQASSRSSTLPAASERRMSPATTSRRGMCLFGRDGLEGERVRFPTVNNVIVSYRSKEGAEINQVCVNAIWTFLTVSPSYADEPSFALSLLPTSSANNMTSNAYHSTVAACSQGVHPGPRPGQETRPFPPKQANHGTPHAGSPAIVAYLCASHHREL